LWKIADFYLCWNLNQVIGETLIKNEIGEMDSYLINPADKILVTVSPTLFQPKKLWNEQFSFTGYLRWQAPECEQQNTAVEAFCNGEKVPVLTFGSVTFENTRKIMRRFLKHWPKDKKIIIQSGWAQLAIERSNNCIFTINKISHDQLFKFASVVIHHGGAGTTASVLHAGVPHIVIPHFGDQVFFAKEVKRLGVGLSLRLSRWPEELPRAVRIVERSKKRLKKARCIADTLEAENGSGEAVKELERLVVESKEV
jgi:UDP:flavonoid glycosyltransferase YjiC (YdhE family)